MYSHLFTTMDEQQNNDFSPNRLQAVTASGYPVFGEYATYADHFSRGYLRELLSKKEFEYSRLKLHKTNENVILDCLYNTHYV